MYYDRVALRFSFRYSFSSYNCAMILINRRKITIICQNEFERAFDSIVQTGHTVCWFLFDYLYLETCILLRVSMACIVELLCSIFRSMQTGGLYSGHVRQSQVNELKPPLWVEWYRKTPDQCCHFQQQTLKLWVLLSAQCWTPLGANEKQTEKN